MAIVPNNLTPTTTVTERLVSTVSGIDGKSATTTTLYTVPAGRTFLATKAIVRITAIVGFAVVATAGIGIASGEDDLFAAIALTGLNAANKAFTLTPTSGISGFGAAGSIIKLGIDVGYTATSCSLAVSLIGFLV